MLQLACSLWQGVGNPYCKMCKLASECISTEWVRPLDLSVTPKVFIPLEIEILFSAGELEEFCTSAIVVDFLL